MIFFLIGHRGTLHKYDENTIRAFKKAIEFGATHIEFDVRCTLDNNLIVIHDKSIDRTTNGIGEVKSLTFSEISKFRTKIDSSKVPLLTNVLEELKGKINFIIEIKDQGITKKILNIVQNLSLIDSCIFSSRDLNELLMLKSTSQSSKICYNITKGKNPNLKEFLTISNKELALIKPDFINLVAKSVTIEFIQKCHDNDILALAWNFKDCNDPIDIMQNLITMGIDGLLIDNFKNIKIIKNSF